VTDNTFGTINSTISNVGTSVYRYPDISDSLLAKENEALRYEVQSLHEQVQQERAWYKELARAQQDLQDTLVAAVQVITTFVIGQAVLDYGLEHSLPSISGMEKSDCAEEAEINLPSMLVDGTYLKNYYLPNAHVNVECHNRLKKICDKFASIMLTMRQIANHLHDPTLLSRPDERQIHLCSKLEALLMNHLGYESCESYTNADGFNLRRPVVTYHYGDMTARATAKKIVSQINNYIQDRINGQSKDTSNTTTPTEPIGEDDGFTRPSSQESNERADNASVSQAGEAPGYSDSEPGIGYLQQ
jgi:hypothetical protein